MSGIWHLDIFGFWGSRSSRVSCSGDSGVGHHIIVDLPNLNTLTTEECDEYRRKLGEYQKGIKMIKNTWRFID
jgi:hypothetical protein